MKRRARETSVQQGCRMRTDCDIPSAMIFINRLGGGRGSTSSHYQLRSEITL